jgi:hypothetical protein
MNRFNISTQIVSPEEKEARLAIRNKVVDLLQKHTNLTTKEIADAIGKDVRATNGLLIAMQKQNKINGVLTDHGRIWRLEQ